MPPTSIAGVSIAGVPIVVAVAAIVYGVMSLITFITYAVDKRAARRGRPRIAEATLHALEFLGGWPGAFLAQRLIRHKNAKLSYQMVFWSIVALHGTAWGLYWWRTAATGA